MGKASFGVASLLIILLVASCVSNSVAQLTDTDCASNVDCALPCRGRSGGVCDPKIHKCVCNGGQEAASNVAPNRKLDAGYIKV
ncbi:hypothetical protein PTKIN_Ptkin02bG0030800 [Pterospermum kingtungense]